MRTFAISDIHGNNALFTEALKQIELKKEDKLVLLGDYIDRGEDSKGVLDTIMYLLGNGFDVACLIGNHEQMLLDASLSSRHLSQWLINGGDKTLLSFNIDSVDDIPSDYWNLLKTFRYVIENDRFVFVHAALNMKIADPYADVETILWERNPAKYVNTNWLGSRKLIHGHTPTSQAEIIRAITHNKPTICIDNGSFLQMRNFGTLCVLELDTLQVRFCGKNF